MKYTYTHDDFLTSEPYSALLSIEDPFEQSIAAQELAAHAKSVGIGSFSQMLKAYRKSLHPAEKKPVITDSYTNFTGQPMMLDAGNWHADDFGIYRIGRGNEEEEACPHPILPVERLVNIDTGEEKLRLAFCRMDRKWRSVIVEKSVVSSRQKIVQLADQGISVTSENSARLVQYLCDLENLNFNILPERKSASRLGYIEGEGFSPFVPDLVFDGDMNFRHIFTAVKSSGSRDAWMKMAREIRKGNVMARIVLAASFASALVAPCGALPFFVHLWGGESGTGKTVALMLAASVWGCPEMGRYIQSFNSTMVGREKLAAFLNHLPLCVDELQLARDTRGKVSFDVYALAEGVGRTRGTKAGGIERTPTWANCTITTGETPITGAQSAAGAVNRVIEIECQSSRKIIEDGHAVSSLVKKNYGFAGKEFVEKVYEHLPVVQQTYQAYFRDLSERSTTEKQAMAAAAILTADSLATVWIFQDDYALSEDDVAQFLASRSAVSVGQRGYRYMCDWVTRNANRMRRDAEQGEIYGLVQDNFAYIIGNVFRQAAEEGGFSPQALLSYMREQGIIQVRGRAMTKCKRINGVATECVCMRLPEDNEPLEWVPD